jgi:3-oxoacyl-[acyl-carrier protein] reductase
VVQQKTAIITGSSRGIGKEAAVLLAKRGINIVVCSRTQSEINTAVQEIKAIQSSVIGLKCDVSTSLDVNSLIKTTIEKFGGN